jgi:hypothetical protein
MTDRAQFEAMLEALINEDQEAAKEIFHNIVVGKSREIYEELLESDFNDTDMPYAKSSEESEDDSEESDDGKESEEDGKEGNEEGEDDGEEEIDGEEGDDADGEEDPFGGEEGEEGEGAIEDRVMDLEDALEELKSEFEELLAGEEHEEEMTPGIHGDGMPMHDIEGEMDGEVEEDDNMPMMEYVNKVSPPKHGDNGVNTKSIVDNMKNNMGGTSANIVNGGKGVEVFANKGALKGTGVFKANAKEENFGNINVPGGKAGKTAFKTQVKDAHGAEKKGSGEGKLVGTGAHGQSPAKNTQSTLRPLKK